MKNFKKALSLLLAVMMIIGTLMPVFAADPVKKEDVLGSIDPKKLTDTMSDTDTTALVIHKLVADSYNEGVPVDHNGGTLTNDQLGKLGENVKGLKGVKFTIYSIEKAEDFKTIKEASPSTTTEMKQYVDDGKAVLFTGLTNGETAATGDDGSVTVNLPKGNYWVIETDRPSNITETVAVPFGITLPLMNQVDVKDGDTTIKAGTKYMTEVNVYPKNLQKKPEMDKEFGHRTDLDDLDSQLLEAWKDAYGPDYDTYNEKKNQIDARIGSTVPYETKTSLKAGQIYKNLSWSDIMSDGLRYNENSLVVKLGKTTLTATTDYTVAPIEGNGGYMGFDLIFTETGVKKVNDALVNGDVEITLQYTATVTKDTVVDMPESNNITFTPGNPTHKNDKEPIGPSNGEITVTKAWADGKAPAGVLVTYMLIDNDNKVVATVTLKDGKIFTKSLDEGMDVTSNGYNVTFKGLNNDKKYRVEEFADGYDPSYTAANAVTNTKNPDTITPTPPEVVTGGKKFVKTDGKGTAADNRLAGAEFVITNADGTKYLAAQDNNGTKVALTDAKKALDDAVDAYNNRTDDTNKDKLKQAVDTAQADYIKAYKDAFTQYKWVDSQDEALVLVSNADGQFEITGLAYGTYKLVEIKAPKGFAKLTDPQDFTVDDNSYTTGVKDPINYELEGNTNDADQVKNTTLTIPQTGGIGTAIFAVVGIGLMAGAVVAMKRREAND